MVEAASGERSDAHELLNNDMDDDERMELVASSCNAMLERVVRRRHLPPSPCVITPS